MFLETKSPFLHNSQWNDSFLCWNSNYTDTESPWNDMSMVNNKTNINEHRERKRKTRRKDEEDDTNRVVQKQKDPVCVVGHWPLLVSFDWFPCCSLLSMMLMRSPSCCFMCSISCSLLVDSKPQIQQQKSSTQYSIPGRACPVPPRHGTIPVPLEDDLTGLPSGAPVFVGPVAEAISNDCLSFLFKTT